jgi:hypothetical protein
MYCLKPDEQYTALVVLASKTHTRETWVSRPLVFRSPPKDVPGIDRPYYGSDVMWWRLMEAAGKPNKDFSLAAQTIQSDGRVQLRLNLTNSNARSVVVAPARDRSGQTVVLVRDERGLILPHNSTERLYEPQWQSVIAKEDETTIQGNIGRRAYCSYDLGLSYPLGDGDRYTALASVWLSAEEGQQLVVAKPLDFQVLGSRIAASNGKSSNQPARRDEPWPSDPKARRGVLQRFAGKAYRGLKLDAGIADSGVLKITLTNCGSRPLAVSKEPAISGYDVIVVDRKGIPVPWTRQGERRFRDVCKIERVALEPTEALKETVALRELFKLEPSGEYTALASLPVIGDVDAVLTAAPVKIKIDANRDKPAE